jgi:hypothetical protein
MESNMTKMKQQVELHDLPEPIALTLDQLKEVASSTAGEVPQIAGGLVPIKSGGIRIAE